MAFIMICCHIPACLVLASAPPVAPPSASPVPLHITFQMDGASPAPPLIASTATLPPPLISVLFALLGTIWMVPNAMNVLIIVRYVKCLINARYAQTASTSRITDVKHACLLV